MAVNDFFNNGQGPGAGVEQDLLESLIVELIQLSGNDVMYIKRNMFNPDYFFSESNQDKFDNATEIEVYVESVLDFSGQGSIFSKFGLELNDNIDFVVSRTRFMEELQMSRPKAGDLIYFPLTKHLLEIEIVEDEPGAIGNFYPLAKLYTYMMKCKTYTYSHEDFSTGISDIDDQMITDSNGERYDTGDKYSDNTQINDEADESLDWSETSPFGPTTTSD